MLPLMRIKPELSHFRVNNYCLTLPAVPASECADARTGRNGLCAQEADWMREERIWPNGLRYLWTDAFGLVLLVSLYEALREERYLDEAEGLVAEVNRVLGRPRGIRIGEEPDRDGQYFHYLAMWLYALAVLGRHRPAYRDEGVALVRANPRRLRRARGAA